MIILVIYLRQEFDITYMHAILLIKTANSYSDLIYTVNIQVWP